MVGIGGDLRAVLLADSPLAYNSRRDEGEAALIVGAIAIHLVGSGVLEGGFEPRDVGGGMGVADICFGKESTDKPRNGGHGNVLVLVPKGVESGSELRSSRLAATLEP